MNHSTPIQALRQTLTQQIVGPALLVDRLLMALLADGHLLVEGAPGLAKTKAIKTLATSIEGSFQRIQFTPDLLPSDITGTEIYRAQEGTFVFQEGPIFNHLVLADEINRAPAKVQSALLEAMGERQISSGNNTLPLPELFLVMATQNPIEQEGTYPLPEAQLDRFLMHVVVDYPDADAEHNILEIVRAEQRAKHIQSEPQPTLISQDAIFSARQEVLGLHMEEIIENYIVQIVMATRNPTSLDSELASWLDYGASPRGTIALDLCARSHAYLHGKDFVSPDDVQAVAFDALRHRLVLSFEAEAAGITPDQVIERLLSRVATA